ncbi:hypothetical protein FBUS_00164 [Fasciolopsis buskii]|uniref:Uncharacterized protein n=1 Tax=Fasciolopsis buskii TaxID=27845 RepID=A0A8E0VLN6_9TREM|nr:hypothetical protein FBUS_00164 [Fasciolopsis buski]
MQWTASNKTSLTLKDLRIVEKPKPNISKTKDLLRRVSQLVSEIKSNPPEQFEGEADDGRYIDLNIFVDNSHPPCSSNLVLDEVQVEEDHSNDETSDTESTETDSSTDENSSTESNSPVIKKQRLITELPPTDSSLADRHIG